MSDRISRGEFVVTSTATLAAAATVPAFGHPSAGSGQGPAIMTRTSVKPVVIASGNGHSFKNGGDKTCIETAFAKMMQGSDVLEALIAGVNIVELDSLDTSVGYGGLPNADGILQLDAGCMHGPTKRAGGVGIEGVRTPSLVALKGMEETDHHLTVGKGGRASAGSMGLKIEDARTTDRPRKAGREWSGGPTRCTISIRSNVRRRCARWTST